MNPDDPLSWITKGDRDLALVQDMLPNLATYPDLICYHCQQAAEKHLKALLLHHGQKVKKTHDLEELMDLLAPFETSISPEHYNNAVKINDYAMLTRYPSMTSDPSEADVLEAVECAKFFRSFAVGVLGI
jgi:HEPN domain-containing protein